MKQFVLGGARSGKSAYAQQLASDSGKQVVYIATAFAGDDEMALRIAHHKQQRPVEWRVVEEQIALADTLIAWANEQTCVLVDCLTLWLTNLLCHADVSVLQQQRELFLDSFSSLPGDVILVSNEVGTGIIPQGELNRRFVDEAGFLHQRLAQQCDRVFLTVAGLPLSLK